MRTNGRFHAQAFMLPTAVLSLILSASLALPASAVTAAQSSRQLVTTGAVTDAGQASQAALAVVSGLLPRPASAKEPAYVLVTGWPIRYQATSQKFTVPVLASARLTSGSVFRLMIPDTAQARRLVWPGHYINAGVKVLSPSGAPTRPGPTR
jgi:hypothetical protein